MRNDPQDSHRDTPSCALAGETNVHSDTELEEGNGHVGSQSKKNIFTLPFDEFVREAIQLNEADREECEAENRWRSPLWTFMRHVQAYLRDGQPDITPAKAWRHAADAVGTLARKDAGETIRGMADVPSVDRPFVHYFGVTKADAGLEFVSSWESTRYEVGYDPLTNALNRAKQRPLRTARGQEDPAFYAEYDLFVSIAGHLQVIMGDRNILLPLEKLGRMLWPGEKVATVKVRVSRLRQMAEQDGLIKKVKRGEAKVTADEFRVNVKLCKVLQDSAHPNCAESFDAAQAETRLKKPGSVDLTSA